MTEHGTYTYTAYSDGNCASAIARATFTTTGDALTATNITATSATLTLHNHTGDWWFKETSPATGTCTAGESDFTNNVSGLIPGTEYTYKAYSVRHLRHRNRQQDLHHRRRVGEQLGRSGGRSRA